MSFCQHHEGTVLELEKRLFVLLFRLGCVLVRLMLVSRHLRLNLEPYLALKGYRLGNAYAKRTMKTAFGAVSYGRVHLSGRKAAPVFIPWTWCLGLTRDGLSPWVMQWVARLATRMSYRGGSG